jgi:hypothetical protein
MDTIAAIANPGAFKAVTAENHLLWFIIGGAVAITLVLVLVPRTKLAGNDKFGICFASVLILASITFGVPNIMAADQTAAMMGAADSAWSSDVRTWINDTYDADATAAEVRSLINGHSANIDTTSGPATVWLVEDERGDLVLTGGVNAYLGD